MLLLNHRPKETLTKILSPELLTLLGFQRVTHPSLDHEVFRLKLPWCEEHAKGASFGSEAHLVLAGVTGMKPNEPMWGFGFTYQRDSDSALAASTVPSRLLRTAADLEQLLYGLGYEPEFFVDQHDSSVEQIKAAMVAFGFTNVQAYRYDVDTIRLRVEDPRLTGLEFEKREQLIVAAVETIPMPIKLQLNFLLLLSPGEAMLNPRLARLDYNFNNRRPAMARLPGE